MKNLWIPVLLGLLLSLGLVTFAQTSKARTQDLFALETERLAERVLRAGRDESLNLYQIPEEITGFGFFSPQGNLIFQYGEVPPFLEPESLGQPPKPLMELRADNRYVFIKPLDFPTIRRSKSPMEHQPLDRMPPPRLGGFVYLQVNASTLNLELLTWDAASILGPLLIGAILALIFYLQNKNQQYRDHLARNSELLRFAQAARTLGHEIKNPLAAILLQVNLLKRQPGIARGETARAASEEKMPEELLIIEEEAQRIATLTERIREFLNEPQGKPESVDLGEFTRHLLKRFSQDIPFDEEASVSVKMDPHRLRSVLENLIQNALESGPDPQPKISLRVERIKGRSYGIWTLTDKGLGIPPQVLGRIFEPFFTTKNKGTGIGLSVSRSFSEGAGGSLRLEPLKEGGVRTVLTLPEEA